MSTTEPATTIEDYRERLLRLIAQADALLDPARVMLGYLDP